MQQIHPLPMWRPQSNPPAAPGLQLLPGCLQHCLQLVPTLAWQAHTPGEGLWCRAAHSRNGSPAQDLYAAARALSRSDHGLPRDSGPDRTPSPGKWQALPPCACSCTGLLCEHFKDDRRHRATSRAPRPLSPGGPPPGCRPCTRTATRAVLPQPSTPFFPAAGHLQQLPAAVTAAAQAAAMQRWRQQRERHGTCPHRRRLTRW